MNAAQWQRVDEIFHVAVETPSGPEREALILSLSNGDDGVLEGVRALLAADERLEAAETPPDRHIGLRLGSYEVGPLVARGGMAAVYEASRADEQFHQRVAVKIMDVRLSDVDLVARFRAERQILAGLEHVAVTRLIDGGVTTFGEPYLVMEFVDGVPIDQHCDSNRLDVPARVRLFIDACAGVAFAHRNLILHRDLKPSNILVTVDGDPKVLDFGTATLLQPERLTTVSAAPLTPAYASPEQLTSQPVGTASDQYSLGLVLYELVTGVPAFAKRASLIGAIERALSGTGPPPPHLVVTSTTATAQATTMTRLRRQLKGDLGTIIAKALAHDPSARYSSVQHFTDDLERWMKSEPILGRTPSIGYQASKFVARHRIAVGTAAVLVLSLIVASVISLQQAAIARTESAKARELNRFLTEMLSSANPSWMNANAASAGSITVRQVLDGASQLLSTEQAPAPEVETEIRRVIARTYIGLGAADAARPHLERSLLLAQERGDVAGIALTHAMMGSERLLRGDFKAAERELREPLAYFRAHTDGLHRDLLATLLSELGAAIAYQRPGDPEAIALMRESIVEGDRVGSGVTPVVLHNLGIQLVRTGRLEEAEVAIRDSLRRFDALASPPPERSSALRTLAVMLLQQGKNQEAEQLARAAAESAARTRPADHPLQPNFKAWWGRSLVAIGDLEQGRKVLQEAYDGYRKLRPAGHFELALPLVSLGQAHRLQGDLQQSERVLREAEDILRKHPAQRDRTADMAGELGLTLRAAGRETEAAVLLQESHDILRNAYGDDHPLTRQALARIKEGQAR